MQTTQRNRNIFLASVFFVLGFSVVFSLVGVLLQTVLANVSLNVQEWLGRIGGIVIIFFGLFSLRLITPQFLEQQRTVGVTRRFSSLYLTSFIFGAAFAVGWTPCVSAALGAILALAATQAAGAFFLLVSYTMGIGIPFLIVGLFAERAEKFIANTGAWLMYIQYIFGVLLVSLGALIFTGELGRVANFALLTTVLTSFNLGTSAGGSIASLDIVSIGIAFFAGLVSFLSPCVLPLIPGFLSYLAATALQRSTS